jgi:hypothetical protein
MPARSFAMLMGCSLQLVKSPTNDTALAAGAAREEVR